MTALQQLGDEKFNVRAILRFIDAEAASAYGGSERTQIALVARLIRAQEGEIERLRKGEFICSQCGLRKEGERPDVTF